MTDVDRMRHESQSYQQVRNDARRYMVAVYGPGWTFKAPETFENLLERWLWAVSADEMKMAATAMTEIERMAKAHKEGKIV